jgi:UPF0716 protein FxsA
MVRRLLLIYAVVELAVFIALVSTIGWGWTLLALLATFVLGWGFVVPYSGSQLLDQLARLRSGMKDPRKALGDSALVTMATVLVLIPGLVTTTLGMLLLVPPVRAVARPGLAAIATRRFRRMPLFADAGAFMMADGHNYHDNDNDNHDYIDGEVIDVKDIRHVRNFADFPDFTDVEPPVLPYGSCG